MEWTDDVDWRGLFKRPKGASDCIVSGSRVWRCLSTLANDVRNDNEAAG
jgi:hypothetical protein